jgi:uncharacterized membrane protein YfcA
MKKKYGFPLAGGAAGAVNGLFGAGGGMVLVPLLTGLTDLDEEAVFPASVSTILPICVVSLAVTAGSDGLPLDKAWPYLLGSIVGGLLAGWTGNRIPVTWLHRALGVLILWGGVRYLC